MNYFEEQLRDRIQNDQDDFSEAFAELSAIVIGDVAAKAGLLTQRRKSENAVQEVMKFHGADIVVVPEEVIGYNGYLDYCMGPSGIMRRPVTLTGKWWRDAHGPMLCLLYPPEIDEGRLPEDGKSRVVALLPSPQGGYSYFDYDLGKKVRVNAETAKHLGSGAFAFYRPFPPRPIHISDIVKHIFSPVTTGDIAYYLAVLAVVTLMGMIQPRLTQFLYSTVIPAGRTDILPALAVLLVSMAVATQVLKLGQSIIMNRLTFKLGNTVEPAAMMRMLSLKPEFFKQYAAGELTEKFSYISALCTSMFTVIVGTLLTTLFSMAYFVQISNITPALLAPALLIIAATLAFNVLSTIVAMKIQKRQMLAGADLAGLTFSMLSGIAKIKMNGAEKRIFARWAPKYRQMANLTYNPPFIMKYASVVNTAIIAAGLAIIYATTLATHMEVGEYMAFNVAYGMVSASVMSLVSLTKFFAELKPMLDIVEPLLSAEVENSGERVTLSGLKGNIEVNKLVFRYDDGERNVLDGVNLKIRPGQYVALVGKTGCGKSSLVRLLLGFEKAQQGTIFYDRKDIQAIDLSSLRRLIGVVLQNSKLLAGDIFANIALAAPGLTMDEAWEAAEIAGIADDIREMPMGMHTLITEGSGSISGGQKQRLMIARAVAPKPKLLIFDESTSALDNITQKHVADALAALDCTRIVIAHRLSTIKECDRIYLLDGGKIAEEGTFDELYAKKGLFYELVNRQTIDTE